MKKSAFLIGLFLFTETAVAQTTAGCTTDDHAAFDFWLGTWNVKNKDGSPAGTNVIDKIQDNCILRENWTSAKGGFTGTSVNYYDKASEQWRQLWLDNQGGNLDMRGSRKGNQMIMRTADAQNKDGKTYYHQISWTANQDGSVRQLWETFTSGTDTVVVFDGLYTKESE